MFKNFITILITLLICPSSFARLATEADAPFQVEQNLQIEVKADGKFNMLEDCQIKLLNEKGRSALATLTQNYNADSGTMEILEAKTINDQQVFNVKNSEIETKEIASQHIGFDKINQTMISFPNAIVGSVLSYKIKQNITKPSFKNHFSTQFNFGDGEFSKNANIIIKSEIKLNFLVNDPENSLEVTEESDKKYKTILRITQKKPIYKQLINESGASILADEKLTWVAVTSFTDFKELGAVITKGFEGQLQAKLPKLYEDIAESAKKFDDPIEQVNYVTSEIASKIRYMGDWKSVEGQLSPRPMAEVEKSQVADCKDYSTATVAILRKIGYKANVAIVMRSSLYQFPNKYNAQPQLFNHAIVRLETKDGKVLWIDPTNFSSMADGIFEDIEDRKSLVLDLQEPRLESIPKANYEFNKLVSLRNSEFINQSLAKINGEAELFGDHAISFTGAQLRTSNQIIKEKIILAVSDELSPPNAQVTFPDLKSRVVKPIRFSYSFNKEHGFIKTNQGLVYSLNIADFDDIYDLTKDNKGDLYLGTPRSYNRTYELLNVKAANAQKLECSISSPWFKFLRKLESKGKKVIIDEKLIITERFISAEEIATEKFEKLKTELKKNTKSIGLVFEVTE